jgi:hypothetical protein
LNIHIKGCLTVLRDLYPILKDDVLNYKLRSENDDEIYVDISPEHNTFNIIYKIKISNEIIESLKEGIDNENIIYSSKIKNTLLVPLNPLRDASSRTLFILNDKYKFGVNPPKFLINYYSWSLDGKEWNLFPLQIVFYDKFKHREITEEFIKEVFHQNPQILYNCANQYYDKNLYAKTVSFISKTLEKIKDKGAKDLLTYIENLYIKKFNVESEEAKILQKLFLHGYDVSQYREEDSCIVYTPQYGKVMKLHLYNCPFGGMSELFRLKHLRELKITNNNVENDFSFLSNMPNLRILNIDDNSIKHMNELKSLSTLTNLEVFKLTNNQIRQIKLLDNMKNLKKLTFLGSKNRGYYGNITKIEGLEKLSNLTDLTIKRQKIEEISGLESLVKLQELNLSCNNIKEIKGIKHLKSLYYIDLSHNKVEKIPEWLSKTKKPNVYIRKNSTVD